LDVSSSSFYVASFLRSASGASSGGIRLGNSSRVFDLYADSTGFAIEDGTAGATRLKVDASGNLGLGVTPSAWLSSQWNAFEGAYGGALAFYKASDVPVTVLTSNAYNDGGWKYKTTDPALQYEIDGNAGIYRWYQAPSGTAGNAITFTQAMTLTATGNLSVGTTTQAMRQNLYGTNNNTVSGANIWNYNIVGINIRNESTTANTMAGLYLEGGAGNSASAIFNIQESSSLGALGFATGGSGVSGGSVPERMRIDSSGNLLVGTTSGSVNIFLKDSANDIVLDVANSSSSNCYGLRVRYSAVAPNTVGYYFYRAQDNAATRFEVYSNGGIANYSANNSNLSDRREKTNFAPAGSYLDKICAIPVQTFNYIDQNLETDDGLTLGVVAQDVQAVAPELVMESNWGTEEEPKMRLSIYQTDLQYALMKALQELKAEFDAYKASHP